MGITDRYILKNKVPIPCPNLLAWARWMETNSRIVAQTNIDATTKISTVFLGLDHNWGDGVPILFETMICGGPQDGWQRRYATWVAAELGLMKVVESLDQKDFVPLTRKEP